MFSWCVLHTCCSVSLAIVVSFEACCCYYFLGWWSVSLSIRSTPPRQRYSINYSTASRAVSQISIWSHSTLVGWQKYLCLGGVNPPIIYLYFFLFFLFSSFSFLLLAANKICGRRRFFLLIHSFMDAPEAQATMNIVRQRWQDKQLTADFALDRRVHKSGQNTLRNRQQTETSRSWRPWSWRQLGSSTRR